jgi:hypothetical protein
MALPQVFVQLFEKLAAPHGAGHELLVHFLQALSHLN